MTEEQQKKRTKCEIWSRAMGYIRPFANFNKGKKQEKEKYQLPAEQDTQVHIPLLNYLTPDTNQLLLTIYPIPAYRYQMV